MLWRMRADFYYATAAARLKHSNAIELLQQFKIDLPQQYLFSQCLAPSGYGVYGQQQ